MQQVGQKWLGPMRRRLTGADADVQAKDGLVTFSVIWALALVFSVVSHYDHLNLSKGIRIALIEYGVLALCVAVILKPRRLSILALLSALMAAQYVYRLPVASNNQTIAFFMNLSIVLVVSATWLKQEDRKKARDEAYERLRIVARLLLATMYFYGIFHKINSDFLDPEASCAVALYKPLTHLFYLEDNLLGRYGSIAATFVVETITLVCLFWRRYFAFGLIIGLVFHYIIPISGFSWYMDFSCLVFALYTLSVPREVSVAVYTRARRVLERLPVPSSSAGAAALILFGLAFLGAAIAVSAFRSYARGAEINDMMAWHSAWIVIWAVAGGIMMVLLTWAALEALPYRPVKSPKKPLWVYAIPATLFVSCLSPYFGLKTESSIAMFSNLHTEQGQTNHLLFSRPPYLADYQREVATLTASSSKGLQNMADRKLGIVRFELERWMKKNPGEWVSFSLNGRQFERVNAASFPVQEANLLERRLLIFKPVDVTRPKVCTH